MTSKLIFLLFSVLFSCAGAFAQTSALETWVDQGIKDTGSWFPGEGSYAEMLAGEDKVLSERPGCEIYKTILSPDSRVSLYLYTANKFQNLNFALRREKAELISAQKPLIDALSHALQSLPALQGTVFRRTNLPSDLIKAWIPGAIVDEPGYLSTSHDTSWLLRPSARTFGLDSITITTCMGHDVSCFSPRPFESEWLLDRGARFKVISHQKLKDEFGYPANVIELEQID